MEGGQLIFLAILSVASCSVTVTRLNRLVDKWHGTATGNLGGAGEDRRALEGPRRARSNSFDPPVVPARTVPRSTCRCTGGLRAGKRQASR
jgi:hypothetical protein